MSLLFSPISIGAIALKHRVVHAPVTRLRADPDDAPSQMMEEYYGQRASDGGLIITESSHVSRNGRGYLGGPGLYEDAHIAGWKRIADAVHAKGGKIIMQLVHDGRQSHVDLTTDGSLPVAPSEVPFDTVVFTHNGWVPVSMHRAIDIAEIQGIVEAFRVTAARALIAGFDGVEVHSANGYLIDTFLQDGTNKRTDAYGGTTEKRARLLLEITEAAISVFGADRVGVRLSPSGQWGSISDSDPEKTFGYVAEELRKLAIAYVHVIEPRVKGTETLEENQPPVASGFIKRIFKGTVISAGGFDGPGAAAIIDAGDADVVAFGRNFTSNPDLPRRLAENLPLTPYNRDAFWGGDRMGYTDFSLYGESEHGVTADKS